jgi:hypothetical protein
MWKWTLLLEVIAVSILKKVVIMWLMLIVMSDHILAYSDSYEWPHLALSVSQQEMEPKETDIDGSVFCSGEGGVGKM